MTRDKRDADPALIYDETLGDYRRRVTRDDLLRAFLAAREPGGAEGVADSIAARIKASDFDAPHPRMAERKIRQTTERANPFRDQLLSDAVFGFGPQVSGAGAGLRAAVTGESSPGEAYDDAKARFQYTLDQYKERSPAASFAASLAGGAAAGLPFGMAVGGETAGRRALAGALPGALAGAGNAPDGDWAGGAAVGGALGALSGVVAPIVAQRAVEAGGRLATRAAPAATRRATEAGQRFVERVAQARAFGDRRLVESIAGTATDALESMGTAERNAFRAAVAKAVEEQVGAGAGEAGDQLEAARVALMAVTPAGKAGALGKAFDDLAKMGGAVDAAAADRFTASIKAALGQAFRPGLGRMPRAVAAGAKAFFNPRRAGRAYGLPYEALLEPRVDLSQLAGLSGLFGATAGGRSQ